MFVEFVEFELDELDEFELDELDELFELLLELDEFVEFELDELVEFELDELAVELFVTASVKLIPTFSNFIIKLASKSPLHWFIEKRLDGYCEMVNTMKKKHKLTA